MNENFQSVDVYGIFIAADKLPFVAENDVIVVFVYIKVQQKIGEFALQESGKRA